MTDGQATVGAKIIGCVRDIIDRRTVSLVTWWVVSIHLGKQRLFNTKIEVSFRYFVLSVLGSSIIGRPSNTQVDLLSGRVYFVCDQMTSSMFTVLTMIINRRKRVIDH